MGNKHLLRDHFNVVQLDLNEGESQIAEVTGHASWGILDDVI